jgi:periplasmic divalent cation tolerance protein
LSPVCDGAARHRHRSTRMRLPFHSDTGRADVADYEHCLVLSTTDSSEGAEALANGAVEARLAASVQVDGPITSTYRWEGEVQSSEEWRITFKTAADRYDALEAFIQENNSYEVPEILCIPVANGSKAYLEWLTTEMQEEEGC